MLVAPQDLLRRACVAHRQLRTLPPDLIELVGQRPSGPVSPQPLQMVSVTASVFVRPVNSASSAANRSVSLFLMLSAMMLRVWSGIYTVSVNRFRPGDCS